MLGWLTAALAAVALAAPASAPVVIDDGHVDVGPRIVDGEWRIGVRDDTVDPPAWRALPDVVLRAVDASKERVPRDSPLAFLGGEVWLLPQVQKQGILWPGWNTQAPGVIDGVRREVTWTLHGVQGPGRFALFVTDSFGAPRVLFDGGKPFPQSTGIDVDTHAHGNWAFSAPGAYLLDIGMSATMRDGEQLEDRATLQVFAGAGDAASAFPAEDEEDSGGSGVPWIVAAVVLVLLLAAVALRRSRTRADAIVRRGAA
jgi:surface-anchored protein/MYXO-CTERM domain-containing protein